MKYRYFRSLLAFALIGSVTASHGICYAKMFSTEALSCHTSKVVPTDCCDVSSKSDQAEIKCCPKPASEAKSFIVQNPLTPESFAPNIQSISTSRPVLYSASQANQPSSFFTTHVLKTAYSYHSPPFFG